MAATTPTDHEGLRAVPHPWSGDWVSERLDLRVGTVSGEPVEQHVGLAVRRNPKRAHLLVSHVLGKHVPADPRVVLGAGHRLGALVAEVAGPLPDDALVIGYAETATGLGHAVAESLFASYLHSTRRWGDREDAVRFEEAHSHATSHRLVPDDPRLLDGTGPIVLVDDELSTGRTVIGTIEALHARHPHERYVVASLIDLRGDEQRAAADALAARLGVPVDVVALARGRVSAPADVLERGTRLVEELHPAQATGVGPLRPWRRVDDAWPADAPDGGRHGLTAAQTERLVAAAEETAGALRPGLADARRVHVLGTEELMYAPLRIARALADELPGAELTFSSTTRSPVLAVDDPGYAIRSALVFDSHDRPDDGPGPRYAYNLTPGRFDAVVVCVDAAGDTPELAAEGGLLHRLSASYDDVVVVVL